MKRDIYELIEKMIDKKVKGADTYINNGSRWLIFTDEKKWIFELTKEGTLWYNYYFFENIFKIISLNVVDNQHHVTKWVENFIRNGVKHTSHAHPMHPRKVEDTIQNGVKNTAVLLQVVLQPVEDTIQNGVKNTLREEYNVVHLVEDTIQNGVKHTIPEAHHAVMAVEDTIQNGVKHTEYGDWEDGDERLDDIIQNGVKHTRYNPLNNLSFVEDTIQNGVKITSDGVLKDETTVEDIIQNGIKVIKEISDSSLSSEIFKVKCKQTIRDGIKETKMEEHHRLREVVQTVNNGIKNTVNHSARPQEVVDNTIKNGIKETKQEPSQRTWMSEQVINNGIKETKKGGFNQHYDMFGTIENGIKDTVCGVLELYNPMNFEPEFSEMKRMNEVNQVLEKGIIETKTPNDQNFSDTLDFLDYNGSTSVPNIIDHVIQNGIKEVKELPDQSGELMGYGEYYARQKDRTYPHNDTVNDVIRDGIKETKYCELHSLMMADHIIRDGIKETWGYTQQPQVRVNEVINKGEKTIWNNDTTKL